MKNITKTAALFAVGIFIAANINAQSFLTSGLAAYYPFNGNANDASGNGHNGIINNVSLSADRFGNANNCYSFNGANSYITISNTANLSPTGDFTVTCWIKQNSTTYPQVVISQSLAGDNSTGWFVALESPYNDYPGGLQFQAAPDFNPNEPTITPAGLNQWYQACYSYTSSNGRCEAYLDGVLVDAVTNFYSTDVSPRNLTIGAQEYVVPNQYNYFFNGSLEDIRIYNRALSANDIAHLHTVESTAFSLPYQNLTMSLNISEQSGSNIVGTVSTTASPTTLKLATKDILNVLAFDENLEGNWPSNSFPKKTTLALAGNSFVVLNGTNILLNVSDIMSLQYGEPQVTSGKRNLVTGLASTSAGISHLANIAFDDTFISGGNDLHFYLYGVLSSTITDTVPSNAVYTETLKINNATIVGDGYSQGIPFTCTGTISASGKGSLNL